MPAASFWLSSKLKAALIFFAYLCFASAGISMAAFTTSAGLYFLGFLVYLATDPSSFRWSSRFFRHTAIRFYLFGLTLVLVGTFLALLAHGRWDLLGSSLTNFWRWYWVLAFVWILPDIQWEKAFSWFYLGLAANGLLGIYQFFTGGYPLPSQWFNYPANPSADYVYYAHGTAGFHLFFAQGLLLGFFPLLTNIRQNKLIAGSVLGILALGIVFSLARSSWLAWAFGLSLYGLALVRSWKKFFLHFLGLFLLFAVVIWSLVGLGLVDKWAEDAPILARVQSIFDLKANKDRLYMWQAGLRVVGDNLWFGVGLFHDQPLREAYEQIQQQTGHKFYNDAAVGVHNVYIQMYLDSGWIGLFGFLALFLALPVWGYYYARCEARRPFVFSRWESNCLLGISLSLLSILVVGVFENCYFIGASKNIVYLWLATLLGLALKADEVEKQSLA